MCNELSHSTLRPKFKELSEICNDLLLCQPMQEHLALLSGQVKYVSNWLYGPAMYMYRGWHVMCVYTYKSRLRKSFTKFI